MVKQNRLCIRKLNLIYIFGEKQYVREHYKTPILFHDWFAEHIDKFPNPFYIYKSGFAIRKDIILKKSLDYYKKTYRTSKSSIL
jgi:hypothetical protein